MCVEEDLLQHLARCASLKELDMRVWCSTSRGDAGGLAIGAPSLLLRQVPALASCTTLRSVNICTHYTEDESRACSARELLEPLASLPFL